MTVVYDAGQLPVARSASRWARSSQVRRYARRYSATHLLRVLDPDAAEETETWWAGKAGVSFAAAIDEWAEGRNAAADDVVVVPLDGRIYAAELERGLVERELVIGEGRWNEQFAKWSAQGKTVRGFEGGGLAEVVSAMVVLEECPFDARMYRYRPTAVALGAAGMYAPAHAGIVVAAALVFGAAVGYLQWHAGRASGLAESERAESAREVALRAAFTGGEVVKGAAEAGWEQSTLLLHRDGLGEMVYGGGFEVSFSGVAPRGFPSNAIRYAELVGAGLEIEGSGWRINRPVGWSAGESRSVEGFGSRELAERLYLAAGAGRAEVASASVLRGELVEERGFRLTIPNATAYDLWELGGWLRDAPYRVAMLRCAFDGYLASVCEMEIWSKGEVLE